MVLCAEFPCLNLYSVKGYLGAQNRSLTNSKHNILHPLILSNTEEALSIHITDDFHVLERDRRRKAN